MTEAERELNALLRTWSSQSVMDTEQLEILQRLVEESRVPTSNSITDTGTTEYIFYSSPENIDAFEEALDNAVRDEITDVEEIPEQIAIEQISVNEEDIIQETLEDIQEESEELEEELLSVDDLTPEQQGNLERVVEASVNIPEELRPVLIENVTSRFSGAVWYEKIQSLSVMLAGIGGIGSYVAFLLSRLKIDSIVMYDDDIVEEVNMSGQLFAGTHIGVNKGTAMAYMMSDYSNYYRAHCIQHQYTRNSPSQPIMICGFDNMEARKIYFTNWKKGVDEVPEEERKNFLFIDGRLAAEEFQVFCIRGDDSYNIAKYATEFLFSDEEAPPTVCSYKQTTFMANMIGSVIVNLFVNFTANLCDPLIERDMPFLTEYNAETMYFNTIR